MTKSDEWYATEKTILKFGLPTSKTTLSRQIRNMFDSKKNKSLYKVSDYSSAMKDSYGKEYYIS